MSGIPQSPQSLVTEVLMMGDESRFLIVEGKTDRAVFWRHLRTQRVSIRPLQGKRNVITFAQMAAKAELSNAVAVIDSNGWVVQGVPEDVAQLGLTCHRTQLRDLEMDLLQVAGLDALVAEHFDTAAIQELERSLGASFAALCTAAAAPIGAARLVNERLSLGIRMDGLANVVSFDVRQLMVHPEDVLLAVRLQHAIPARFEDDVRNLLASTPASALACGHDLMRLIARASAGPLGNGSRCTAKDAERLLRAATSGDMFAATPVGQGVLQWLDAS